MRNELNAGAVPVRGYGASLGRIARTRPGLSAGRGTPANEDHFKGFGNPTQELGVPPPQLTVERLHAAARVRRSRLIAATAIKVFRFARDRLSRFAAGFIRSREERSTYLALCQLDSRTLRDIGVDRSEIRAIAIEIAGGHPVTRIHAHRAITSRNS